LLLALLVPLVAHAQKKPAGQQTERTTLITKIQEVDFKNFSYKTDAFEEQERQIQLRNGKYVEAGVGFECGIREVVCGDLTGDGNDEAVVVLWCNGGGSEVLDEGFIYTVRKGRAVSIAKFKGGSRQTGIDHVKIEGGLLIVDRRVPAPNDPVCCASYYNTTTYRWDGKRLVQVGRTSEKKKRPSQ